MRAKVQAAPYPAARKGTDGMKTIAGSISDEIGRPQKQVENVISLLDGGEYHSVYRKIQKRSTRCHGRRPAQET